MIINERNKTTVPRAFYPSDYKHMSDQGYTGKGWQNYQESPYKEYQRRLEDAARTGTENNKQDPRT